MEGGGLSKRSPVMNSGGPVRKTPRGPAAVPCPPVAPQDFSRGAPQRFLAGQRGALAPGHQRDQARPTACLGLGHQPAGRLDTA